MKRTIILALAAPLCAMPAHSAGIGFDPVVDDLKCFAAYTREMAVASDDSLASIQSGQMFFSGKLYGRDPGFDLARAFKRYKASLDPESDEEELTRCDEEVAQSEQAADLAGLVLDAEDQQNDLAKPVQVAARGPGLGHAGR